MQRINLKAECNCKKCKKAVTRLACDPGTFEAFAPRPRLFEGSPKWNDGNNYPPGFNELTEL